MVNPFILLLLKNHIILPLLQRLQRQVQLMLQILFDCVVILSWIALGVLAVTTAQDKVKSGSD